MERLLKELCLLNGTSGRENEVRDYIIEKIKGHGEFDVDPLGNLIVSKKGKNPSKNKVMLAAHMDEVGMMITYITDDGFLKFTTVGGIDSRVLLGRAVLINGINGIIGIKPIHLLDKSEEHDLPKNDSLYIDIGAKDKADAEKYVNIGDCAYFQSDFVPFGDGFIKSKAIDDRAGCAILIDMICREQDYDLTFAFTVQEEVGLRGAKSAAFEIAPDYAIVAESTTAADIEGVEGSKQVCKLGSGAVISFMDRTTIYDKELYDTAFELAKEKNIKMQPKTYVSGGNDAGSIHQSRSGVKTITVSLPCRYIHSPSCVIKLEDMYEAAKAVQALADNFAGR
ncbi:MAG: M42 family metallopeptidase [Clostridiales bacterium]|nr:M42 family metallopeptidase [Clostridiales bacterium]